MRRPPKTAKRHARRLRAERLEPRLVLSARSLVFPQGGDGAGQVADTYVDYNLPATSFAAAGSLDIDLSSALAPRQQALLRFADLYGSGPGQIRDTDTIVSATLELASEGYAGSGLTAHRMLQAWSDTATWSSLGSGVQTNGVEAMAAADGTLGPYSAWSAVSVDITASLRAWQAVPASNFGWMITSIDGSTGRFGSSESTAGERRPVLRVQVERAAAFVSVSPADPLAFEDSSPGMFVISRTDTVGDLVVPYVVGGTATSGTDYRSLPGSVTIPAGSRSASVTVVPRADSLAEGPESVTLQITSSVTVEPDRAAATITIRDPLAAADGRIVPLDETFALESLPGARHTIYLDFLGSNRAWSRWNNEQPIDTPPFSLDGDTTTFSDAERLAIQECWAGVAEDFRPFEINVTTALPEAGRLVKTDASDREWGIRAVFGNPTNWHEVTGGMAYYNSFGDATESPAWIVPTTAIAEIASHEVGHTVGLHHDGWPADEYYDGHGSGETLWGPIMGGPDFGLTQWSQGSYPGATNQEDDLQIIASAANGFGYRADDHGDSSTTATALVSWGGPFGIQAAEGTIGQRTDVDWFQFTVSAGTHEIIVDPLATIGNLDVRADLFDATGGMIATSNPVNELSATFRQTLAAGTYFVRVDGDGNPDPTSPGYDDYGSLGFYNVRVAPAATTLSFQQGIAGYAATDDTTIGRDFASTSKAAATTLFVDGRYSTYAAATLVRFGDLFGSDAGLVPSAAVVESATLELNFTDPGAAFTVHQVLRSWSESDTYASLVDGVTADGIEAAVAVVATSTDYVQGWHALDVTAAFNAWLADPAANHGLLLQPGAGSINGNDIASSESATPPKLTVTFRLPVETPDVDDYVVDTASGPPTTLPELPPDGLVTVVKRGAGVLILDRANAHTGGTLIEAGEAIVRNVAALGSGPLEIRAGATVTFDVADGTVPLVALSLAAGGRLDFGAGRVSIAAGGYSAAVLQDLLRNGIAAGWSGTEGFSTRSAATVTGGGLGFVVNDDGSASIGFATSGDTNLDGLVDILDVSAMLAAGRFNTGDATTWAEGDTNYDGLIDILDIGDVLASGHFNAGPYLPAPTPQAAGASLSLSPTMAAFAAFWADTAAGSGTATVPGPRRTRLGGPVA